ncbi:MAG: GAF domain-containing sensor histidine kinase [Pedobacter sp.]|nr:MAG: GAF domain-containing sensor histidine kinase [Pedobacter sp.]
MSDSLVNFEADLKAISRIESVSSILDIICRITGMGFAAIARVTEDRWVACAVNDSIDFGLKPGGELKLETTICYEIRTHQEAVVIDNVSEDDIYSGHHTPLIYGFQSYISVPIVLKNGEFFGTLCAIDPKPASLNNPHIRGMFAQFSELIAFHLEAAERLAVTESRLDEERKTAELREHFIAVLGHDLRNPVGAISNAAQLLMRMPLDERMLKLVTIAQDASFRMKVLIDNVLDFARGHLGEGIGINKVAEQSMGAILDQVISELQIIWSGTPIERSYTLNETVSCDRSRIAQLFSNLLGNALSHGKPGIPVSVAADTNDGNFRLSVSNAGERIPDAAMKQLFQPFSRGEVKAGQEGLGLGLYIASAIAVAHGGTLSVESSDVETCFTFVMPLS